LREIPSSLNTAGPTHKKGPINTILKGKQKIPSSKELLQNDEWDKPRKRRKSMLPVIRNSEVSLKTTLRPHIIDFSFLSPIMITQKFKLVL
jgi:hypothetical protein